MVSLQVREHFWGAVCRPCTGVCLMTFGYTFGVQLTSLASTAHRCMYRRGEAIQQGVAALTNEREALETSVMDMAGKTQAIDRWLSDNEAKLPAGLFFLLVYNCGALASTGCKPTYGNA